MFECLLRFSLLLVIAAPLQAQTADLDPDSLAGMDAEVRGDWIGAVEAFSRAAANKPTPLQRARLRHAKNRGKAWWKASLANLIEAKRHDELPLAIALARLIIPKDSVVARAVRIAKSKGFEIPTAPPEHKDAVKQFPARSPGGRMRRWTPDLRKAETIIDAALDWLVKTQDEKGFWGAKKHGAEFDYDAGVTGLALLALMSRGPAGLDGARGKAAHRAAAYFVEAQAENGSFGGTPVKAMYATTLGAEALAEYAVIANKRKALRPTLARARDFLIDMQTPGLGWRYTKGETPNDTSITSRAVCALERLRRAGIHVPHEAFAGAVRWVESVTDLEYGQIGYDQKGGSPARPEGLQDVFPPEQSQSMTAAGCLVHFYAGRVPKSLAKSLLLMTEAMPRARNPDMYYWAVGARLWQAARGHVPNEWYAAMLDGVQKCAGDDGGVLAKGPWREAGRVYSTSMCVLALSAPYREPPATGATTFFRTKTHTVAVTSVTPTGIYIDNGMAVKLTASGSVRVWLAGPRLGPGGTAKSPRGLKPLVKKSGFGGLVARIGPDGKPFRIKDWTVRPKTPGQLYLLVNDTHPEDNKGAWEVTLELVAKK